MSDKDGRGGHLLATGEIQDCLLTHNACRTSARGRSTGLKAFRRALSAWMWVSVGVLQAADPLPPSTPSATTSSAPVPVTPARLPGQPDPRLEEARAHVQNQRFHKASDLLVQLTREPLPASTSAEVYLLLGQSLEAIGFPSMAALSYRNAFRYGQDAGEFYGKTLEAWASLSLRVDDTLELGERLLRAPTSADPASQAQALSYLRAQAFLGQDDREKAMVGFKAAAGASTLVGRQASYALAVLELQSGHSDAAFALLEPLTGSAPSGAAGSLTAAEEALNTRLQALAQLGLARVRYSQTRFDDAAALYAQVKADSPYAALARFEGAWVDYWRDRPKEALEALAPLRLEYFNAGNGMVSDADLLAAIFYLRTNQHDLADGVIRGYLDQLFPLRVALRDFTRAWGASEDSLETLRLLLGVTPPPDPAAATGDAAGARDPDAVAAAEKALPLLKPFATLFLGDRELNRRLEKLARIGRDREAIGRQPAWWKSGAVPQYFLPLLAEEELRTAKQAGSRVQALLQHERFHLSDQNLAALALRREVTIQRLAQLRGLSDPDPYKGEPLPPFEFIRPGGR